MVSEGRICFQYKEVSEGTNVLMDGGHRELLSGNTEVLVIGFRVSAGNRYWEMTTVDSSTQ